MRYKRVRRYEVCDLGHRHYQGWDKEVVGMGEPYCYDYVRPAVPYYLQLARLADEQLNANVIKDRLERQEG